MHQEVINFIRKVEQQLPGFFVATKVVDFGSYDLNGSNRDYFRTKDYTGVDIHPGRGVDVLSLAHEFKPSEPVDVVVSTEMLEHDKHWDKSIKNAVEILRPGGLFLFTCADPSRGEHGTHRSSPNDSPATLDYYRGLSEADIRSVLDVESIFESFEFEQGLPGDLRFWGVKYGKEQGAESDARVQSGDASLGQEGSNCKVA